MSESIERVLADWASSESCIIRLWLFGSRSRDDHREDSDLDVTIQIGRIGKFYGPREAFAFYREQWEEQLQPALSQNLHLLPFGHTDATREVAPDWQLLYVREGYGQSATRSPESFDAVERIATIDDQIQE